MPHVHLWQVLLCCFGSSQSCTIPPVHSLPEATVFKLASRGRRVWAGSAKPCKIVPNPFLNPTRATIQNLARGDGQGFGKPPFVGYMLWACTKGLATTDPVESQAAAAL